MYAEYKKASVVNEEIVVISLNKTIQVRSSEVVRILRIIIQIFLYTPVWLCLIQKKQTNQLNVR